MKIIITLVTISLIIFVFYGSATIAEKPSAQHPEKEEVHELSGFLDDYTNFKIINPKTKAQVWIKPPHQDFSLLSKYDSVLLSPIEMWMDSDTYRGIDPNELKLITDYFFVRLGKNLRPDYKVVYKPGPNVMHMRIAITGVKKNKPNYAEVYNLIPVKLVWEVGNSAYRKVAGKQIDIYEASLELEIRDSETGERLVAAIDKHQSSKYVSEKGEDSWLPIQEIIDFWTSTIRTRLDEAHNN